MICHPLQVVRLPILVMLLEARSLRMELPVRLLEMLMQAIQVPPAVRPLRTLNLDPAPKNLPNQFRRNSATPLHQYRLNPRISLCQPIA